MSQHPLATSPHCLGEPVGYTPTCLEGECSSPSPKLMIVPYPPPSYLVLYTPVTIVITAHNIDACIKQQKTQDSAAHKYV